MSTLVSIGRRASESLACRDTLWVKKTYNRRHDRPPREPDLVTRSLQLINDFLIGVSMVRHSRRYVADAVVVGAGRCVAAARFNMTLLRRVFFDSHGISRVVVVVITASVDGTRGDEVETMRLNSTATDSRVQERPSILNFQWPTGRQVLLFAPFCSHFPHFPDDRAPGAVTPERGPPSRLPSFRLLVHLKNLGKAGLASQKSP